MPPEASCCILSHLFNLQDKPKRHAKRNKRKKSQTIVDSERPYESSKPLVGVVADGAGAVTSSSPVAQHFPAAASQWADGSVLAKDGNELDGFTSGDESLSPVLLRCL